MTDKKILEKLESKNLDKVHPRTANLILRDWISASNNLHYVEL